MSTVLADMTSISEDETLFRTMDLSDLLSSIPIKRYALVVISSLIQENSFADVEVTEAEEASVSEWTMTFLSVCVSAPIDKLAVIVRLDMLTDLAFESTTDPNVLVVPETSETVMSPVVLAVKDTMEEFFTVIPVWDTPAVLRLADDDTETSSTTIDPACWTFRVLAEVTWETTTLAAFAVMLLSIVAYPETVREFTAIALIFSADR